MVTINAAAAQTAADTMEVASASQELSRVADSLRAPVQEFKVSQAAAPRPWRRRQ